MIKTHKKVDFHWRWFLRSNNNKKHFCLCSVKNKRASAYLPTRLLPRVRSCCCRDTDRARNCFREQICEGPLSNHVRTLTWSPTPTLPEQNKNTSLHLTPQWSLNSGWAGAAAQTTPPAWSQSCSSERGRADSLSCHARCSFEPSSPFSLFPLTAFDITLCNHEWKDEHDSQHT